MNAAHNPWIAGLGAAAIEVTLIYVLSVIVVARLKTAQWQRLFWQCALSAMIVAACGELNGVRQLWRGARPHPNATYLPATQKVVSVRTFDPDPGAPASPLILLPPEIASPSYPAPSENYISAQTVPASALHPILSASGWIAWFYIVVGTVLVGRLFVSWLITCAFRLGARSITDSTLLACVGRVARMLGVRRHIALRECKRIRAPFTFGLLRPVIALPARFTTEFPAEHQELALLHEVAHVAAGDAAWRLVANLFCALFWWHPVAWLTRHSLLQASEAAADEASAVVENGPARLADCLVRCARQLHHGSVHGWVGMGDFKSGIGRRIERLMRLDAPARPVSRPWSWTARLAGPSLLSFGLWYSVAIFNPTAPGGWHSSVIGSAWAATAHAAETLLTNELLSADQPRPELAAARLVREGRRLLDQGDRTGARQRFLKALELQPGNRLAKIYLERADADATPAQLQELAVNQVGPWTALSLPEAAARLQAQLRTINSSVEIVAESGLADVLVTLPRFEHVTLQEVAGMMCAGASRPIRWKFEDLRFVFESVTASAGVSGAQPAVSGSKKPATAGTGVGRIVGGAMNSVSTNEAQRQSPASAAVRDGIIHLSPPRREMARKLRNIRLKEVSIDGIPVGEFIKILTGEVRRNDPEGKGITFLVSASTNDVLDVKARPVRIHAQKNIAVEDVLNLMASNTDPPVTWRIEDFGVVVANAESLTNKAVLTFESPTKTDASIPVLGDLPYIGKFFRHTETTNRVGATIQEESQSRPIVAGEPDPITGQMEQVRQRLRSSRIATLGPFDHESLQNVLDYILERVAWNGLDNQGVAFSVAPLAKAATITIATPLQNVSLEEALNVIVMVADRRLQWRLTAFGVTLSASGQTPGALHTRFFKIADIWNQLIDASKVEARAGAQTNLFTWMKDMLASRGVDLSGDGKAMFLNDRLGVLMIRGTLEDLDRVETVIRTFSPTSSLVGAGAASNSAAGPKRPALSKLGLRIKDFGPLHGVTLGEAIQLLNEKARQADVEDEGVRIYLGQRTNKIQGARLDQLPVHFREVLVDVTLNDALSALLESIDAPELTFVVTAEGIAIVEAPDSLNPVRSMYFRVDPGTFSKSIADAVASLPAGAARGIVVDSGPPPGGLSGRVTRPQGSVSVNPQSSIVTEITRYLEAAGIRPRSPSRGGRGGRGRSGGFAVSYSERGIISVTTGGDQIQQAAAALRILGAVPVSPEEAGNILGNVSSSRQQMVLAVRAMLVPGAIDGDGTHFQFGATRRTTNSALIGRFNSFTNSGVPRVTGVLIAEQLAKMLTAWTNASGKDSVDPLGSRPLEVTTVDRRQAQVKVVDIRHIVIFDDTTTNRAEPFELGPIVDVIPTVAADGYTIHLNADCRMREFLGYIAGAREPARFRLRQAAAQVIVPDGQTLMLDAGFAIDVQRIRDKSEVPLGKLRVGTRIQETTNYSANALIFLITPRLIDASGNPIHSDTQLRERQSAIESKREADLLNGGFRSDPSGSVSSPAGNRSAQATVDSPFARSMDVARAPQLNIAVRAFEISGSAVSGFSGTLAELFPTNSAKEGITQWSMLTPPQTLRAFERLQALGVVVLSATQQVAIGQLASFKAVKHRSTRGVTDLDVERSKLMIQFTRSHGPRFGSTGVINVVTYGRNEEELELTVRPRFIDPEEVYGQRRHADIWATGGPFAQPDRYPVAAPDPMTIVLPKLTAFLQPGETLMFGEQIPAPMGTQLNQPRAYVYLMTVSKSP